MRDHSKTLREGQSSQVKKDSARPASTQPATGPDAKFKSTSRSGTVRPPPVAAPAPENKQPGDISGLRRVEVRPLNPSLNATLLGSAMPVARALTSMSPPPVSVGEPMTSTDIDTLDTETLTFNTRNDGTRNSSSRPADTLGRTLVGVSKNPPKGPTATGHVKSAQVRSIGAPDDPQNEDKLDGRNTKPDPHQIRNGPVQSVRAEPVSMPIPGVRARHEQPMVEAKARNIGVQGAREFTGPSAPEERPSFIMAARNRKLDKVLYAAVGLAIVVVAANEVGLHWPSPEEADQTEEAVARIAAAPTPAGKVDKSPTPNSPPHTNARPSADPVGTVTQLDSLPSGAQILHRGAVIANTPTTLPRTDTPTDYLLRKPGYDSQLVRITAQSPAQITLELSASEHP